MSSVKCKNCSLINFANEEFCRRCESLLNSPSKASLGRKDKSPRSFSFLKLAVIVGVIGAAYYIYSGSQAPAQGNNASQRPSQATPQPAGLSRTQYDQQRAGNFANNIKDNPSFEAKRQHDEETQKVMNQVSNSSH